MKLAELFVLVSVVGIWTTFVLSTVKRLLRIARDLERAKGPSARCLSLTGEFALSARLVGIGPSGGMFEGIVRRKNPEKQL